jgi:CHAT domain-containing protein/predicted negative regulator of RcsB-dependent stress response
MIDLRIKGFLYLLILTLSGVGSNFSQTDVRQLTLNTPIERGIAEKETHSYRITAKKDDFVRVVVEQLNTDVELKLLKPDGQILYQVNNSNSREETERVSFVVTGQATETFQIEILFRNILAGRSVDRKGYRIELETRRPVNKADQIRLRAEELYDKANLLRLRRNVEARQNAIKIFQEAAGLFAQAEDQVGQAFSYYAVGQLNGMLSNFDEAGKNLSRAIEIFSQLGLPRQRVKVLTELSTIYFYKDDLEAAAKTTGQALSIYKELGDKRGEAEMIGNLGTIAGKKAEPRKALAYFLQALPILQSEGDKTQEGRLFSTIGSVYDDLGEPFTSLEYYEKALKVRRELRDERAESFTLTNMSIVLKSLGQYERAIEATGRALDIFSKIGQKYGVAATLNILGAINDDLGDTESARNYYERAIKINREIKDSGGEATLLNNIAVLEVQAGNNEKALELLNKSLQILRRIKAKRLESHVLVKIGEVWQIKGEPEKALEYFDLALPVLRETEDRSWQSNVLYRLGEIYREAQNFSRAKKHFAEALRLNREAGELSREWLVLLGLARTEKDLGDLPAAQEYIERAIRILENTRTNLKQQKFRRTYLSKKQDFYSFYIDLLIKRHKKEPDAGFDGLAFQASENARAKSLLESLGESRFDIREGIDSKLLEKEKVLRQTINAKDSLRLSNLQNKRLKKAGEFEKELTELLDQYDRLQSQIRRQNPQFATLTRPEPVSLPDVQADLLDENTVLLEYSLGESASYLFLVTKSSVEIFTLPKNAEIEKVARRFIAGIKSFEEGDLRESTQQREARLRQAETDWTQQGKILSGILFGQISEKIRNKRLLMVTPGILQYIPLAALPAPSEKGGSGESFLIERNEIVSLPSASVLSVLRANKRDQKSEKEISIAILADPVFSSKDVRLRRTGPVGIDGPAAGGSKNKINSRQLRSDFSRLRFSRIEAKAIENFVPPDRRVVALDFAASPNFVRNKEFQQAKIIHFATHGIINSDLPELSSIVLSMVDKNGRRQNGYLRLTDIYNLRLNADLIVLSACDSGLGKEIRGEGLIGLTRGFMYAGAESVVASLWKVEDRATAELMKKFYRAMLRDGQKPAAALRSAQVEMLNDRRWNKPFYWAAFTLQGDWR